MTCQYCGEEITEDNMVDEGLEVCEDCYYENEALQGNNEDEYYMKKAYEVQLNQYIIDNYANYVNKEREN